MTESEYRLAILRGERRRAFYGHIRATDVLPAHHLVRVVRNKQGYSPRFRAAALRNLCSKAPLEVTLGQPFGVKRRLVRAHFQV